MRCIRKGSEPAALTTWRSSIRPRGFIPPWNEFTNPPREEVRRLLSLEQRSICCYCCASIIGGNFHIEHFRPREYFDTLTYTWRNLLASCESWNRDSIDGEIVESQSHCGDAKGNWFECGVTTDPQSPSVEALFRFPLSGKIYPSKRLRSRYKQVQQTIDKLNLNAPSLVKRRSLLLTYAGQDVSVLPHAEWRSRYLLPDLDGTLHEFWPALNYNYNLLWVKLWP